MENIRIHNPSVIGLRFSLSILFILASLNFAIGQNEIEKLKTRMNLDYFNNSDKTRSLKASVYAMKDRERVYPVNEKVYFYYGDRSNENILDSAITDNNGIAQLDFTEDYQFLKNEDGYISISAYFDGNEQFTEKSADINFIDLDIELMLTEEEGAKTIEVRAYEIRNEEERIPVRMANISYYVPRYFNDQKIGESEFNMGKSSLLYPENLAGDTIGNVSIIARIEDHSDYGNVERSIKNFRWGTTQPIEEDKSLMTIQITIPTRALWHTNAPLWMIITLIILLTGVWSHYFYVIYQLRKLYKLGRQKKIGHQSS